MSWREVEKEEYLPNFQVELEESIWLKYSAIIA